MTPGAGGASRIPARLPLVETHLHLEGSIPPRVLVPLARRAGRPLPPAALGPGRPLQRGRGFQRFLDAFVFCASLLRGRDDVEAAAAALLDDLRAEGILYAEISFSPQVHLRRGVPLAAVVAGLAAARERARRAGGPAVGFIADGGRLWGAAWLEALVDQIREHAGEGVVALGLGGEERVAPARAFRKAFDRARSAGLGVVAHAGEGGTPRAVREVIESLGVRRVGHGIAAAADPSLLRLLESRRIVLEICPTSNVLTGAVPGWSRHPLRRILDAGVRVALGSDDRTLFGTTLRREYDLAQRRLGVGPEEVPRLVLDALEGSFAPEEVRRAVALRIGRSGARHGRGAAASSLS